MKKYFDSLRQIEKSEFFTKFKKHINERDGGIDATEEQTYQTLKKNSDSLTFYFGILNEMGIENLILPHHATEIENDKDPNIAVKTGGEKFHKVIEAYINNYIPHKRFPIGTDKIQKQKSRFFNNDNSTLKADFLWVCNHKDYAHPNEEGVHYDITHSENKIYMGNGFHRFVAYGLWISENGFKPLELYYAHYISI